MHRRNLLWRQTATAIEGDAVTDQPEDKKPLTESVKQKLDELEVDKHLHRLVDESGKVANEAVERAGGLAHERRDDVAGWLDTASGKVNEKTKGQYAEKVEKVRTGLLDGLDKLASRRRLGDPVAPIEAPDDTVAPDTPDGPDAPDTPVDEGPVGPDKPYQGEGL